MNWQKVVSAVLMLVMFLFVAVMSVIYLFIGHLMVGIIGIICVLSFVFIVWGTAKEEKDKENKKEK